MSRSQNLCRKVHSQEHSGCHTELHGTLLTLLFLCAPVLLSLASGMPW